MTCGEILKLFMQMCLMGVGAYICCLILKWFIIEPMILNHKARKYRRALKVKFKTYLSNKLR